MQQGQEELTLTSPLNKILFLDRVMFEVIRRGYASLSDLRDQAATALQVREDFVEILVKEAKERQAKSRATGSWSDPAAATLGVLLQRFGGTYEIDEKAVAALAESFKGYEIENNDCGVVLRLVARD